jgi:hypothetical protein
MLSIIMLGVIMLSVVVPLKLGQTFNLLIMMDALIGSFFKIFSLPVAAAGFEPLIS